MKDIGFLIAITFKCVSLNDSKKVRSRYQFMLFNAFIKIFKPLTSYHHIFK